MAESCSHEASSGNEFSSRNKAIGLLAKQIKGSICDASPLAGKNDLYADLLNAATNEIDWLEIAQSIIEDVAP
jgi:hypothetical protein